MRYTRHIRYIRHNVTHATYVTGADGAAAGGAMLLSSTLISQLGMRLVPFLPNLVPALLEALEITLGLAPPPDGVVPPFQTRRPQHCGCLD